MALTTKGREMKEAFHEYWDRYTLSERDMIQAKLKREGKHPLATFELYYLKGMLDRRGEGEGWIDKIDGTVGYEENKDDIIAKYGRPLPGEETDAEAKEAKEEDEMWFQAYTLNFLEKALKAEEEAEERGIPETRYPPIPELIDTCHEAGVPDAEIRHMLIGSKYEIKEEKPEFDFAEMKETLDSVVGDVTELKKTVRTFEDKFVTKDNLKQELTGMESRMTERITEEVTERVTEKVSEKVGEITTRQIREELQRLRKEYAELPPEIVPLEEIPKEEEVSEAYRRELRTVETWTQSVAELKNYLYKYKAAPPFDMTEDERLKMIEVVSNKLIALIPDTEEGINNLEIINREIEEFALPSYLKQHLSEKLGAAELDRYAVLI